VNFSKAINLVSSFSEEQQPKLKLATDFLTDDFIITRIVGLLFCTFYFNLTDRSEPYERSKHSTKIKIGNVIYNMRVLFMSKLFNLFSVF